MNLLDLPIEIIRLIVQHAYEPWSIELSRLEVTKSARWRFRVSSLPEGDLRLTCRTRGDLATEAERKSFTGKMYIKEETCVLSLVYEAFMESAEVYSKLEWVRQNVTSLRFSNPAHHPALWRIIKSIYAPNLPKLQRIELDCRYHYHFAVHNVFKFEEFISGKDGKLERLMDFRQSFFLGCEDFLNHTVRGGLRIGVVRDMGVREGTERCRAVVVAIDYIADDAGRLILDWDSLQSKEAVINGWPEKIRETLGTLEI